VAADEQLTEVVVDDSDDIDEDDAAPLGAVEFDLEPAEEVEVEE
jgi:hypothetical protein